MPSPVDGRVLLRRLLVNAVAVFVVVVAYLLPMAPIGLNVYDEGVRLYGAQRILSGDLPYHDFFAYYGPAHFYWPALLFKLFGERVLVARLGQVLFVALAATSCFIICQRAGLRPGLSLLPVAAIVLPINSGAHLLRCDPAFSLLLFAGALLVTPTLKRSHYLAIGIVLGLATIFRQDFGAYGCFAALATMFWIELKSKALPTEGGSTHPLTRRLLGSLGSLLAGILIVTVPTYGALVVRDPGRVFDSLVLLPARMMPHRTLPYLSSLPPLLWTPLGGNLAPAAIRHSVSILILATPPFALATVPSLLVRKVRHQILSVPGRATALLFVLVSGAGIAVYALGRSDVFHVYPLYVLSAIVMCLLAAPYLYAERRALRLVRVGALSLVSFGLGLMLAAATADLGSAQPLNLLGASRIMVPDSLAWIPDAVHDIQEHSPSGPIFVANQRHDRVHWNALILYVLSRRPSGTYFHDFIPGITTTELVQERIGTDLRKNDVRVVLVWKTSLPDEPNQSRFSSNVHVLDDYLESEFIRVRDTSDYDILVKR